MNSYCDIGSISECEVPIKEKTSVHSVKFDSLNGSIICTSKSLNLQEINVVMY